MGEGTRPRASRPAGGFHAHREGDRSPHHRTPPLRSRGKELEARSDFGRAPGAAVALCRSRNTRATPRQREDVHRRAGAGANQCGSSECPLDVNSSHIGVGAGLRRAAHRRADGGAASELAVSEVTCRWITTTKIEHLRQEVRRLKSRVLELEEENEDWRRRYAFICQELERTQAKVPPSKFRT